MHDTIVSHTNILLSQIERLKELYPELKDDDELLAGTIEGATNIESVLDRLTLSYVRQDALAKSAAQAGRDVQSALSERAARLQRGAEALKALMFAVMNAAGMQKAVLPTATLSISKGRPTLALDDDFKVQGYVRTKTEPMRSDILAALTAGDEIPGARLVLAEPHLTIRPK